MSFNIDNQWFIYSTYIPYGLYNNKAWYRTSFDYGGLYNVDLFIYWNTPQNRWECWDLFDQISGPDTVNGTMLGTLTGNTTHPTGMWSFNTPIGGFGYLPYLSERKTRTTHCPRIGCLEQVISGGTAQSATTYTNFNSIGYYNGQRYYQGFFYTAGTSGTTAFLFWNSGQTRWECRSVNNNGTPGGINFGNYFNPVNTTYFPQEGDGMWTQYNPQYYISNTTRCQCLNGISVETYLKYAEAVGLTQSAAVP